MDFLVLGLLFWSCVAATQLGSAHGTLQRLQARIDAQETKPKATAQAQAQATLLDVFLSKADQGSIARDHWDGEVAHFDLMDTNADHSLTAAEFEAAVNTMGHTESSFVQTSTGNPTSVPCWKSSYVVAATAATCPSGQNYVTGLCWPACPAGWTQASFVCYSQCPAGWTDEGALCSTGGTISANTAACPWYDACCLTFAKGQSVCPSGWANNGCTCSKPIQTQAKQSQTIAGVAPNVCPAGFNLVGLGPVCSQNSCKSGYNLVAGVCWSSCGSDYDCGGVCTANSASCNTIVAGAAAGSLTILAGAAATIGTAGAALAVGVVTVASGVAGLTAALSFPVCS